jgi:hypothetical protein
MSATTSQQPHLRPSSPEEALLSVDGKPPQHKRVYQACIPCRRRKVKCDLGSVDNPGDPPCVRCRRESKECFFSATRRKRKTDDGGGSSLDGYELGDDYIIRNGRKMAYGSPAASIRQSSMGVSSSTRPVEPYTDSPLQPGPPLTPGGSIGRAEPLRRPQQNSSDTSQRHDRGADEQLENFEAQEVLRREVYGPHDALDLLYKAATDRYVFPSALSRPPPNDYAVQGTDGKQVVSSPQWLGVIAVLEISLSHHLCGAPLPPFQ